MPRRLHCLALLVSFALPLVALAAAAAAMACPPQARPSPPLAADLRGPARAQGRALVILAIGSSTTVGVGASRPEASFPAQLAGRLTQAWGEGAVTVLNAGVSGESAPATLKRLEAFMAHKPVPDLVIWQVGTNDLIFGSSAARLGAAVGQGLDAVAAAGARAMVIDQQYYPGILNVPRFETFVAAVGEAAAARKVPLLARYAMMKEWAGRDPGGYRDLLSWDRFHMSDAGYACLAELLAFTILAAADPAPAAAAPAGQAKPKPAARPR